MRRSAFVAVLLLGGCLLDDSLKPTGALPANRLGVEGGAYVLTQMGSQKSPPFIERDETSCRLAPYRVEITDTLFLDPEGTYKLHHWRLQFFRPEDASSFFGHSSPVNGTLFVSGKVARKRATLELMHEDNVVRRFTIRGSTLVSVTGKRVGCPERVESVEQVYRRIPR